MGGKDPISILFEHMKIVICGSMSSARKMMELGEELTQMGHEIVLPKDTREYAEKILAEESSWESTQNKIEHDLIRGYFEEIKNANAILVANFDKRGIRNYIGGNAFLEMGFAHVLYKRVFLLNAIPDMIYTDEIRAMQPIMLHGNLLNIK